MSARADPPAPEHLKFLEETICPILVEHCYQCHSVQARDNKKLQGELYLDSTEGTSGRRRKRQLPLVKGKLAASLLIKALKFDGLEMPPSGKLSGEIVTDFSK